MVPGLPGWDRGLHWGHWEKPGQMLWGWSFSGAGGPCEVGQPQPTALLSPGSLDACDCGGPGSVTHPCSASLSRALAGLAIPRERQECGSDVAADRCLIQASCAGPVGGGQGSCCRSCARAGTPRPRAMPAPRSHAVGLSLCILGPWLCLQGLALPPLPTPNPAPHFHCLGPSVPGEVPVTMRSTSSRLAPCESVSLSASERRGLRQGEARPAQPQGCRATRSQHPAPTASLPGSLSLGCRSHTCVPLAG